MSLFKTIFHRRSGPPLLMRFDGVRIDFAGVPEKLPSRDVLTVPDPNIEVSVNPGTWENFADHGNLSRSSYGFARGEGTEIRIGLDTTVKLAQEFAAVAGVIFPGVFAVEKKTNRERLIAGDFFAEHAQTRMKIGCGRFGFHAAIDEADEIRQVVITKQPADGLPSELNAPGLVEAVGIGGNAVGIAKKTDI